jgi:hypothetical protein
MVCGGVGALPRAGVDVLGLPAGGERDDDALLGVLVSQAESVAMSSCSSFARAWGVLLISPVPLRKGMGRGRTASVSTNGAEVTLDTHNAKALSGLLASALLLPVVHSIDRIEPTFTLLLYCTAAVP